MKLVKGIILTLAIISAWGCGNSNSETATPANNTTVAPTAQSTTPLTGTESTGTTNLTQIANIIEIGNYQGDANRAEVKVVIGDNSQYFNYQGWVYRNPTQGYQYSFYNTEKSKQNLLVVQGASNGFLCITENQYNGTTDATGRSFMFFKFNNSSAYQLGLAPSDIQSMATNFGDSYANVRNRLVSYFASGKVSLNDFRTTYYPNSNYSLPINSGTSGYGPLYGQTNSAFCTDYTSVNCINQNLNTGSNLYNTLSSLWTGFSGLFGY